MLNEYLAKVGGKEAILAAWQEKKATAKKGKKRGRASTGTEATNGTKRGRKNGHPKDGSPPVSASKVEWKPPSGSWEEHVTHVDACEGNEGTVVVYLTWKTGQKTQHPLAAVYKRCPQQMLRFYESHLFVFSSLPLPNLTNTSLGSLRRTMMPSKRPHQKRTTNSSTGFEPAMSILRTHQCFSNVPNDTIPDASYSHSSHFDFI